MSLRLEMLQVARLAPKLLGESAELVERFFRSQQNEDGGFKDRTGKSDLYYTVFGLEGLLALQVELELNQVKNYLLGFGAGDELDFVHVCSLARCWAAVSGPPAEFSKQIASRIESFRTTDGGYNQSAGTKYGTAYGAFLALGACQDLKLETPEALRIVQSLKFLETEDGAWTNERFHNPQSGIQNPQLKAGSTNATAAAVTVLRNLGVPINSAVGDWLLARAHSQGGFVAVPGAPIPDLLSTATALHALAGLERDVSALKESCLDFIDTLWTNEGGFHGHWGDDHLDCEYTYYGLLALGHLSF